jgi:opacity protein-like surface antigen
MNSIKLSVIAVLLTSTLAMAGGKSWIAPESDIVPIVVEPALTGFYAGLGYSCLQMDIDEPADMDIRSMTALSITAGYNFNEYFAIEGRYTAGLGDLDVDIGNITSDKAWDMSNIGVYLKPQYSMEAFSLYGLLGYGQLTLDDDFSRSVSSFQYGLGVNIMATDNVGIFIDYRRLYDDEDFDGLSINDTVTANSYTLGVNYHF